MKDPESNPLVLVFLAVQAVVIVGGLLLVVLNLLGVTHVDLNWFADFMCDPAHRPC